MSEWFESLTVLEKVFSAFALSGGLLFLVRIVLLFVGMGDGDADGDFDSDGHADFDSDGHADFDSDGHADFDSDGHLDAGSQSDLDHGHTDHHDPAQGVANMMSFKLLSFQGLTGFFMMFGLVGMAISRAHLGSVPAVLGGTTAGLALVWVTDKLFRFAGGLQSSGSLNLRTAINEQGTVYLTIPGDEPGKVRLNVQERLMVMEAISEDGSRIPTGTLVRVVGIASENVLIVKKLEQLRKENADE